jgi:hypothetical protein
LFDPKDFEIFSRALGHRTCPINPQIFTKRDNVSYILMSELVRVIKELTTEPYCYLNLIDHSCSTINTLRVLPEEVTEFKKYIVPTDIETGFPQWGGKSKRKRKKNTKRKKNKNKKRRRKLTKKI